MVPKHLRKSNEGLGSDQESLMASLIELQERIKNDKSILRQPIDTGVRGVKDLVKAVIGGTQELQELLLNECTIIYECKICRNLFRSLANFISHKRIYCIKNFSYFTEETTKQEKELFQQNNKLDSEVIKCSNEINLTETKVWLNNDNDRIVPNNIKTEKNNCLKSTRRIKISPVKITRKCDIAKIADGLSQKAKKERMKGLEDLPESKFHSDTNEGIMMRRSQQPKPACEFEKSNNTPSNEFFKGRRGLEFLESVDSIQLQAMEKISPYNEAFLQENGKFRVTPQGMQLEENENLENYKCTVCETHFITKQTLSRHVQIHHKERICYPCPICRTFFPSPSSTYRHLSKDHHKTEHQIRRLRPKVLAKASKRKLVDNNPKTDEGGDGKLHRLSSNLEGVLNCRICGKLFNRQAVLRVHLTSCKERDSSSGKSISSKATNQTKSVFPVANNFAVKSAQQKSGILVRRDYCKKLSNAMNYTSSSKNPVVENHLYKEHSLKRVNKWRTVLQKLQKQNNLEVNEKSGVKAECA